MVRVIAFVDHEIGHRLLTKLLSNRTEIEVAAVVTTMENGHLWWPSVQQVCTEYGVNLYRYPDCDNVIKMLRDIDWYFLLSWKHVMPEGILKCPQKGVINLHYSLLPKYRGVYPVNWALINGDIETGITYHYVDEKIDAGPIIIQQKLKIFSDDTSRTLQLKLDDLAFEAFDHILAGLRGGERLSTIEIRDDLVPCYKSRQDFISSNELNLNSEWRAKDLLNLLRGKTFLPESQNLFYIDSETGEKCYIRVEIERVPNSNC